MLSRGYRLQRVGPDGATAWLWERVRVPRIDEGMLDTVAYLYASHEDAATGARGGGSGILLAIGRREHIYLATAKHVAKRSLALRANSWTTEPNVIDLDPARWIHHADGDDLSVYHLTAGPPTTHGLFAMDARCLLDEQAANEYAVGPGDDIYMIGRFIKVEGREKNTPAMRFGHIAMRPAGIEHPGGFKQLSYLVELHSLPGYSGSAVFLLIREGDEYGWHEHSPRREGAGFLLGIDWGHIHDSGGLRLPDGSPDPERRHIELNTGMACVVPAWRLRELLNSEPALRERSEIDTQIAEDEERRGVATLD